MSEILYSLRQNKGALAGLLVISFFVLVALLADLIAPYGPAYIHENALSIPPVWQSGGQWRFIMGTDDLGRDLFSRLVHGARLSMGIGFLVVALAANIGTVLGLLAGFYGGIVDAIVMRLVDILMSIPSILLAIIVVTVLNPNLTSSVIAVSIVALPGFIRLVRAQVMVEKRKPYVMASQSFGASDMRQAFINILPNCVAPMIVQITLGFSEGILNAAALGFLGLGAQPPTPEWGTMLADSRAYIESAPWLVTLPGLCILIVVLAFNVLGDGLRDALDPKMKK